MGYKTSTLCSYKYIRIEVGQKMEGGHWKVKLNVSMNTFTCRHSSANSLQSYLMYVSIRVEKKDRKTQDLLETAVKHLSPVCIAFLYQTQGDTRMYSVYPYPHRHHQHPAFTLPFTPLLMCFIMIREAETGLTLCSSRQTYITPQCLGFSHKGVWTLSLHLRP